MPQNSSEDSRVGFPSPLYAIANVDDLHNPGAYAAELLDAGVRVLQLRAKSLGDDPLTDLARSLAPLARARGAWILINDRIEVCLRADADGVHLGQQDAGVEDARARLGARRIIGLSTHTGEHLQSAPLALLSYLAVGPVFLSPTKRGHAEVVGVEGVRAARSVVSLPLVAIGGITTENAGAVYAAGADSVAVISDLRRTEDLRATVRRYSEVYDETKRGG